MGGAGESRIAVAVPALQSYAEFALMGEGKEISTTMALVRLFSNLLKEKVLGPRIVPIVADEARTFGMANLFRQVGIYSPIGQLYEPEDAGSMLYSRRRHGQLFEEGGVRVTVRYIAVQEEIAPASVMPSCMSKSTGTRIAPSWPKRSSRYGPS